MHLTKKAVMIALLASSQLLIIGSLIGLTLYVRHIDEDLSVSANYVIDTVDQKLQDQLNPATSASSCASTINPRNPDGSFRTYGQMLQAQKAAGCY